MKTYIASLLLLFLYTIKASGQDNSFGKISLTSPEAASIAMYTNYPVDYASGVPNIEIPLFEINTKAGKIPFKISYHIGSFKPANLSGIVGFGWTLSPNIGITRSVNGGVDGVNQGFSKNTQLAPGTSHDNAYLLAASENNIDVQPDDFYYSLVNKSGQFIYNNIGKFVTIPFDPIRIQHIDDDSFSITDDDGTIYTFGKTSGSSTPKATEISENSDGGSTSAWKVTQIIPYDKSDTIRFTYGAVINHTVPYYNLNYLIKQDVQDDSKNPAIDHFMTQIYRTSTRLGNSPQAPPVGGSMGYQVLYPWGSSDPTGATPVFDVNMDGFKDLGLPNWQVMNYRWNNDLSVYNGSAPMNIYDFGYNYSSEIASNQVTQELLLTGISYRGGSINFQYNGKKLSLIESYGWTGPRVKAINFYQSDLDNLDSNEDPQPFYNSYSNTTTPNKRFELDSVVISGTQGKPLTYRFNYKRGNSNDIGPVKRTFGVYGNYGSDFWGFSVGGSDFIEPLLSYVTHDYWIPIPGTVDSGSPTQPHLNGMAKQNANIYIQSNSQEPTSPQPIPLGILTGVQYPTGGSASFYFENNMYESPAQAGRIIYGAGYRVKEIHYRTAYGLDSLVKQYKYGINENGVGRTRYKLSAASFISTKWVRSTIPGGTRVDKITTINSKPFLGLSFSSGAPIIYPDVTEYSYSPAGNSYLGKTVYHYYIFDKADDWVAYTTLYADKKNNWRDFRLMGTDVYKVQNNTFVPMRKSHYDYTEFIRDTVNAAGVYRAYYNNDPSFPFNNVVGNMFAQTQYQILSGVARITTSTDSTFENSPATPLAQQILTEYDPATFYKKKETTYNSDGRKIESISRFINNQNEVSGLSATQVNNINQMMTDNRLNNPLENLSYSDAKLESTSRFAYDLYPIGVIQPSAILRSTLNSPFEEKIRITKYDIAGNITERQDNQTIKTSYIWGYNKVYPIGEIKNATLNDVFFNSFEESREFTNDTGNSTLDDSKTGHYSHTGTYTKALSGLDAGNYILSYWQKTGSSWSWVKSIITLTAANAGAYTISLNVQVDDVRFYPQDALMTTYTYDELVGMTSSTDAKGEITTFEYDGFQRLKNIRNKDGKIVKHMDYHYQGQ